MLLSPSCFGPVSQSPLSLHCFSHLLSPSCFGPVRQYPQYLLDCQCHSLLLISCPIPAVKLFCLFHHICCRPYHVECTGSLPTSEVKRHRARLVLGWGTAWEDLRVLTAFTWSNMTVQPNVGANNNTHTQLPWRQCIACMSQNGEGQGLGPAGDKMDPHGRDIFL